MAVYEHGSSKTHIQITSSSPPFVASCVTRIVAMMAGMEMSGGHPGGVVGLSSFMHA